MSIINLINIFTGAKLQKGRIQMNSTTTALTTINAIAEAQNTKIIEKVNQSFSRLDEWAWATKMHFDNNSKLIVPENCERIVKLNGDTIYLDKNGKFICGNINAAYYYNSEPAFGGGTTISIIPNYYHAALADIITRSTVNGLSFDMTNGMTAMNAINDPYFAWSSLFTGKTKVMFTNASKTRTTDKFVCGGVVSMDERGMVIAAESMYSAMSYINILRTMGKYNKSCTFMDPASPVPFGYIPYANGTGFSELRHDHNHIVQYSDYLNEFEVNWVNEYNKLVGIEAAAKTEKVLSTKKESKSSSKNKEDAK